MQVFACLQDCLRVTNNIHINYRIAGNFRLVLIFAISRTVYVVAKIKTAIIYSNINSKVDSFEIAKIKIAKIISHTFTFKSRKFSSAKISRYTVLCTCLMYSYGTGRVPLHLDAGVYSVQCMVYSTYLYSVCWYRPGSSKWWTSWCTPGPRGRCTVYSVLTCTVFVGIGLAVMDDEPPDVPPGLVALEWVPLHLDAGLGGVWW